MKLKNLIAGVCALGGFAVFAAETVEYWDPVGKVTRTADAIVVTAGTTMLGSGWYVVKDEVSRAQINVTGTAASPANLILEGGGACPHRFHARYKTFLCGFLWYNMR